MDTYNIEKTYNKFRHKYRVERANPDTRNWSEIFLDKDTVYHLPQFNFSTGAFIFRLKPYRFYRLRSIGWFFRTSYCKLKNKLKFTKTLLVSIVIFLAAATTLYLNLGGILEKFQSLHNDTNQNQSSDPKEISQPIIKSSHHDEKLSKQDSINMQKTDTLHDK